VTGTEPPELFLVSFFSRDAERGVPAGRAPDHAPRPDGPGPGIIPLTTGWGRHLLQPQQTQSAIYVFEPPFDYALPITVRYGIRQSDEWHREWSSGWTTSGPGSSAAGAR
jgi:hypothetical protein